MALLETIQSPADLKKLSVDQLGVVAQEIREAIFQQVSKVGGHLAPNLGVVELTLALHYVFDFAHDRLLFDVGHQCYPHKLVTGRLPMLANLRTRQGMAGFPEPRESPYDLFSVGHAGTGISTAVGMARGDTLNGQGFDSASNPKGRRVVSIIGDASIVNGVAMEGLNGAGTLKRQFLVILNDNGMSIAKPQGALAQYFDRLRINPLYTGMKRRAREVLESLPGGSLVEEAYHRMGEAVKGAVAENAWFEHFGLLTVGPIDGHDLPLLIEFLAEARDFDRPLVLHVKTVKGKGYAFAEGDSTKFHSPNSFTYDPDSCRVEIKKDGRSFTSAWGEAMTEIMRRDPKVVACTAAMPGGTGMDKVAATFPERSFDTGICESHAMDMMAGLAKTGWKPYFAVYSTFLQRAFDQAFQEVSLQGLAVRLCLDRAGLVGGDGAVHHGFCDISILRVLPKAALMAAMDEASMIAAMEFQRTYDDGLSAVRYPRDNCSTRFADRPCPPFELGKARPLIEHAEPDVAILAFGVMAISACEAADAVGPEVRASVYDARFAKPVDTALIRSLLDRRIPIITIEDHGPHGGFGAAVLEAAADMNLDASRVVRMSLPDHWIYQDSRPKQLAEVGLDAPSIARQIRACADRWPIRGAHARAGGMVELRPAAAALRSDGRPATP
ncbi:MAG: 1-deoxy-D-xylulose-5-phosphate synthase [Phycisphaerales bacterium]|nr:1-deoxy-D-xylulose-5-phosphate synthase [Phycisphaerales bacterium]